METASKKHYTTIDEYFANLPEKSSLALKAFRSIVLKVVPEAEDVISYNMPAFRYFGILVYYAAYKNHIGFYPADAKVIDIFHEDLLNFKTSKGTIQFPLDKEIPQALVEKILLYRKACIDEKNSLKKKLKKD